MPDIQALIRYIKERRITENGHSGYSFVRDLPPTIRDTFFAQACLKLLKTDSPDGEIVGFLSEYDSFDFYRNTPMLASGIKGIRVRLRN